MITERRIRYVGRTVIFLSDLKQSILFVNVAVVIIRNWTGLFEVRIKLSNINLRNWLRIFVEKN